MEFIEYSNEIRNALDQVNDNCGKNPQKMEKICQGLEERAKKTSDDKLLGFIYFYRGQNAYLTNQVGDLFLNCLKGMEYQERAKEWEYVAISYNLLGITSANQGNALFAMDYYVKGLEISEKHNLLTDSYILNLNIGTLYMRSKNFDIAKVYFEKSLHILNMQPKNERFYIDITAIYLSIAKCQLYMENIAKSDKYVQKILEECYEDLNDKVRLAVKAFQAQLYEKKGKQDMCKILMDEIDNRIESITFNMDMYDDFYDYAKFLIKCKKYEYYERVSKKLTKVAEQSMLTNMMMEIMHLKIQYFEAMNNQEQKNECLKKFYDLSLKKRVEENYMTAAIASLRTSLEEAKKQSKKMEVENLRLQKKSETDALTGLANRFYLNSYAERIFQACYVRKAPLAVEILDIDYFKQFNDNYGHQAGDECVRAVADTIRSLEEHGNIFCARYGGDEFVVIYDGYTKEQIEEFTLEIKNKIADKHIVHEHSLASNLVTVSQGVCYDIPDNKQKIWDYLYSADKVLYQVKKKSRNSYGIGGCEQM